MGFKLYARNETGEIMSWFFKFREVHDASMVVGAPSEELSKFNATYVDVVYEKTTGKLYSGSIEFRNETDMAAFLLKWG